MVTISGERGAGHGCQRHGGAFLSVLSELLGCIQNKQADNRVGGWGSEEVEDPYYGSNEGFDVAFEQCVRMSKGWMKEVLGVDAITHDMNL